MLLAALGQGACSAEAPSSSEVLGVERASIIEGSPSGKRNDAVVLLTVVDGDGEIVGGCTATLVAPNLIVTARHCVSTLSDGSRIESDHRPGDLVVSTGVDARAPESPVVAARGKAVFVEGVSRIEGNDIALVLLDRRLSHVPFAPIRLGRRVTPGESLTAVGWGIEANGELPNARKEISRIGVKVVGTEPNVGSLESEFVIGQAACSGDSGGPMLSESGAVVGIISRVGNGVKPEEGTANFCVGPEAVGICCEPSLHEKVVRAAFAAAGEVPWLEGTPNPSVKNFGLACQRDDDCGQGRCADVDGAKVCVQECADQRPCPDGYACDPSGARPLCLPSPERSDIVPVVASEKLEGRPAQPEGTDVPADGTNACALGRGHATSWNAGAMVMAVALAVSSRARRRRTEL
jgi:hypothetical protein